ncbi:hypothetical protein ACFVUW_07660 [Streptomyces xiamenensis]|uniref:hypothetical protein n=1 Tax=Streptomyces xiamenensis TaxID=408015 RepID=UPI0036E53077
MPSSTAIQSAAGSGRHQEGTGPSPLTTPVTSTIDRKPWRDAYDFNEAVDLLRHLSTACFIVIAYLTGMRPGEVLGLRTDCCPDPEPDENGAMPQPVIYGHVHKIARDEDGNHVSTGVMREAPWVAIAPVVHAVRVLEQMVPADALLFRPPHSPPRPGNQAKRRRIAPHGHPARPH